jgi:hypothetical protein
MNSLHCKCTTGAGKGAWNFKKNLHDAPAIQCWYWE